MTTDTAALQERIEAALIRATDDGADRTEEYAAAVLPIVAEEVRKAKAEAWQEGVNFALPNAETTWYPQHNPYRATHYPEGDPVTDHPIDTEALRARAEHVYRHGG